MKLEEIKVDYVRFMFNKIEVKVKILKSLELVQFAIGLNNPKNKYRYENYFVKIGEVIDGDIVIKNKYIENPPFKFYQKFLLVDNKLDVFYKELEDKIIKAKSNDIKAKNSFANSLNNKEKIYFKTFKNLKDNKMSLEMKDKIVKMFGEPVLSFCLSNNLTAVFTSDPKKARLERVHIILSEFK